MGRFQHCRWFALVHNELASAVDGPAVAWRSSAIFLRQPCRGTSYGNDDVVWPDDALIIRSAHDLGPY